MPVKKPSYSVAPKKLTKQISDKYPKKQAVVITMIGKPKKKK